MRIFCILFLIALGFSSCNTSHQSTINMVVGENDSIAKVDSVDNYRDQYPIEKVTKQITNHIENSDDFECLQNIYSLNNYRPFFTSKTRLIQALTLLRNSKVHGLNPEEYNYTKLDSLFCLWDTDFENELLASKIELYTTKGVYNFCKHLNYGKLNSEDYHFSWKFDHNSTANFDSNVVSFLTAGKIAELEVFFEPLIIDYAVFKKELEYWYSVKSKQNMQYPGFLLRKGDSNKYVAKLKKALAQKRFLTDSVSMVFDSSLFEALKKFQEVHGLNPDGVPGKRTYFFLNWTYENYVNTLKVNLERLRWLPDSIKYSGVVVNIPSANLQVYTNAEEVFSSKIVVGKYKKQTPVLHSEIDYLVFNPCWTVPHSIATEKMLPKIQKDSNYLKNRNMFIGLNGKEQQVSGIDFSNYNKGNFPYKIYQRNGDGNALGKVKFMFYNKYSIYLHDTPSKQYFNKDIRTYSHGCVRVQNAMDLADLLLYKLNTHTKSKQYHLKKGYPEIVNLKNRIPISILYLTCFYSKTTKQVKYFTDVYSKDLKVLFDLEKIDN